MLPSHLGMVSNNITPSFICDEVPKRFVGGGALMWHWCMLKGCAWSNIVVGVYNGGIMRRLKWWYSPESSK